MTEPAPRGVNPYTPNAARMYDYFLGGKDNFKADRALAALVEGVFPEVREGARQNRKLIGRVVEYLCRQGVTQFLDLGSGLPARENVHEVAQRFRPEAQVVYVDNDPVVATHGRALLADPRRVAMVLADGREPEKVLGHPDVRAVLDLDRPVAVLMMFFLHLVPDEDEPHRFVAAYRQALAPGSYLAISHVGTDAEPERLARVSAFYQRANLPFCPRPGIEIGRFFGDFELVEPGLANGLGPEVGWPFADPEDARFIDKELARMGYAGIGRKP
ncbi:SAM-dependent methyltransferase [Nonomuraea rhizosphaerae]|uniref:SAM-dependent methyltransferase n=1 Tax=Nonomuraea rhizosphaerae TaxID=2665663 RepID=UPI001C5E072E|nr:SAM-dependent methyltransferase [Nonomuraea rhizosphaerae]